RAERTLPGIAAIEEKNLVVASLGTNMFDHRCQTVEPTDPAVGLCQRCKLLIRQRISRGRPLRNAETLEEVMARKVRGLPLRLANAEIDRRLAEIDRHQLAVNVGDVQQRDIAEGVEPQQL